MQKLGRRRRKRRKRRRRRLKGRLGDRLFGRNEIGRRRHHDQGGRRGGGGEQHGIRLQDLLGREEGVRLERGYEDSSATPVSRMVKQ